MYNSMVNTFGIKRVTVNKAIRRKRAHKRKSHREKDEAKRAKKELQTSGR